MFNENKGNNVIKSQNNFKNDSLKINDLNELSEIKYYDSIQTQNIEKVTSPSLFAQQLEELEKSLGKLNEKHKDDNVEKNIRLLRYYSSEGVEKGKT